MDEEFRYNLTATNVCGGSGSSVALRSDPIQFSVSEMILLLSDTIETCSPRPARCLYSLATKL